MSIWKGAINFGLIHIPVSLESAKEDKNLSFKMVDARDHNPVGYMYYNKKTGEKLAKKNIVRSFEYQKGQEVILTEEDFEQVQTTAGQDFNIEQIVDLEELDPLLFERPYYLVPQKNVEKSYHLLREALDQTHKVAIGKIIMRNRPHLAALMARGDYLILELLRFPHAVLETHEADYLTKAPEKFHLSKQEIEMAKLLIEGLEAPWDPTRYEDTYYQDMMELIEEKVKTGKVKSTRPMKKAKTTENVSDLMPLLKKSLEKAKIKARKSTNKNNKEAS